jgi:endonuclease/exonuclease/phosphatase family metal-dependent hydrolase
MHTHQQESTEQNEQVVQLMKVLPRERTIIVGDFNAVPGSTVIQTMQHFFTDADPLSAPTWGMHLEGCLKCRPRNVSTRLDYIFASRDIRTRSFTIEHSRGSDHLPISVVIEL